MPSTFWRERLNSGQSLTLLPIGTVTTVNQFYFFVGGFTINAGATLNVGTGANVLIAYRIRRSPTTGR